VFKGTIQRKEMVRRQLGVSGGMGVKRKGARQKKNSELVN